MKSMPAWLSCDAAPLRHSTFATWHFCDATRQVRPSGTSDSACAALSRRFSRLYACSLHGKRWAELAFLVTLGTLAALLALGVELTVEIANAFQR